jgi:hypothetical protein
MSADSGDSSNIEVLRALVQVAKMRFSVPIIVVVVMLMVGGLGVFALSCRATGWASAFLILLITNVVASYRLHPSIIHEAKSAWRSRQGSDKVNSEVKVTVEKVDGKMTGLLGLMLEKLLVPVWLLLSLTLGSLAVLTDLTMLLTWLVMAGFGLTFWMAWRFGLIAKLDQLIKRVVV